MAKVGKRKNVEPAGSGLKAKRQQKKNNVNNGVLKERLADIGVFKEQFVFQNDHFEQVNAIIIQKNRK
jgi:hypothetical protein